MPMRRITLKWKKEGEKQGSYVIIFLHFESKAYLVCKVSINSYKIPVNIVYSY